MFNFDELKIIKGKDSEERKCGSFVGIRRDRDTKEMHFILPRGFEDFNPNYNNVKYLFFNMYKTFKKFVNERKDIEKILDKKPQSKDNVSVESNGSYCFTDSDDNEVIMYSKINMIEAMIELHKDLDIEALIQEPGLVEEIDYSKVDNLINNGIFLKNNSIIVDSMVSERNIIQGIPAEIIEIYCYIYNELLVELDYDINDRVKDIAYNFSYKNLTAEQGLFNEYTFESTITILKDRLDLVHRYTAYKDSSYWLIYDAVEKFLYSGLVFDSENEKGFWGVNNFYQVWEDMCNTFFMKEFDNSKILYCDSSLSFNKYHQNLKFKNFGGYNVLIDENFVNNFFIRFNDNTRWMRPDFIVQNNNSPIEMIESKGVFYYEIERSHNIFVKDNVKVKLSFKKIDGGRIDLSNQLSVFEEVVKKFSNMTIKNYRSANLKTYPSLTIRQVNSKLYYLNGISENDFLTEWGTLTKELKNKNKKSNFDIHCIDWKYLPSNYFDKESKELNANITKQHTYEWCLYNNLYCNDKTIRSQFGIPYYMSDNESVKVHSILRDIDVCKINFNKIQSVYLNE